MTMPPAPAKRRKPEGSGIDERDTEHEARSRAFAGNASDVGQSL
jgi:hypothetical protein